MPDNEQQGQTQPAQTQVNQPIEQPIRVETSDNSRLNKGEDGSPISTKEEKK